MFGKLGGVIIMSNNRSVVTDLPNEIQKMLGDNGVVRTAFHSKARQTTVFKKIKVGPRYLRPLTEGGIVTSSLVL